MLILKAEGKRPGEVYKINSSEAAILESFVRQPWPPWEINGYQRRLNELSEYRDKVDATSLSRHDKFIFMESEEARFDGKEERRRLAIAIDQLWQNGLWSGFAICFPNLKVDDTYPMGCSSPPRTGYDRPLQWRTKRDTAPPAFQIFDFHSPATSLVNSECSTLLNPFGSCPSSSTLSSSVLSQTVLPQPEEGLQLSPNSSSPQVARMQEEAGIGLGPEFYDEVRASKIRLVRGCPENLNCQVKISNLPEKVFTSDIIDSIHEGGLVFLGLKLAHPPERTSHVAYVIFKKRQSAVEFLKRGNMGIVIGGKQAEVRPAEMKTYPWPTELLHQTRVLEIEGPAHMVDGNKIRRLFSEYEFKFLYPQQKVIGDRKKVQFHFLEIIGGSREAYRLYAGHIVDHGDLGQITVKFAPDPCGD
ncbi:uncharacterized protein L3040_002070 [Drepanopeziza brunnea f. sp. 'multigermtubi']|uniref:Uncharacterized protein n=1 Tax=Marssonina brunnea f. sp. multigermtubi (strain MB_m1) TaxID=1072389 RepID=K1Y0N4_MARBU|nr:uncharacterized protein MBM_02886 [Drepanopeziza brunnea f. sp. 'multigermtubi' MB_m1]EKD18644.1 hypothetical protein MBM_02886 [Drepanopeziza brunnea f. sp. 'multigermtubi' MB_m1]KAJ5052317.1 hypothetical protein L3040_002070 [Drepanopeziza brunnea f. sp. 'multigermtubi']